jgi:hypothetical protein
MTSNTQVPLSPSKLTLKRIYSPKPTPFNGAFPLQGALQGALETHFKEKGILKQDYLFLVQPISFTNSGCSLRVIDAI